MHGGNQEIGAVERDHGRGEQGRPVIRGRPVRSTPHAFPDERDADADKGGSRSHRVAQVMIRVYAHRGAVDLPTDGPDATGHPPLHEDDADEDGERPRSGHLVRRTNPWQRRDRDADARGDQHDRDDGAGERLRLAMTERMVAIRWLGGNLESAPDDERPEDVRRRLDRVGDQGIRVSQDSRDELHRGESRVDDDAELRGANPTGGERWHAMAGIYAPGLRASRSMGSRIA